MLSGIYSEWGKYRRTAIPWILFLVPLAIALILLKYGYPYRLGNSTWTITHIFDKIGDIWYGVFLPFFWGLIPGMAANLEASAGRWISLRITKVSPARLYLSKLAVIVIYTGLSMLWLIALVMISAGILNTTGSMMNWMALLLAIVVGWISSLPLIIIGLWLAEAFGWPVSVGFGSVGVLVAAIIGTTSLGNGIWMALPWTWPVRFSYSTYMLLIDSSANEYSIIKSCALFIIVLGIMVVLAAASSYWFKRREV
ncbi:ABC transporter permease [Paenibacillus azoreducens]|uniref:Multidrug ABC transporter permease n=1 Tax=Paenibacillus azoreducens TaxID=116718 RepID=A0A920CR25_9BACL|nr:ABC transporter permease [Paenibacillus azoreducens]GIO46659.1 multidrug ABC transporter permease [Paenibacillus azoreducens]